MVVLFYDLSTRDGRLAIELRRAIKLGDGSLYAPAKETIYSCAYKSQLERIIAFGRALSLELDIVDYIDGNGRRSHWQ